jgi:hypothetical protein
MNGYSVNKHGKTRFWAVYDPAEELVCLCVYKRRAAEVVRRLSLQRVSSIGYPKKPLPEKSRTADANTNLCHRLTGDFR